MKAQRKILHRNTLSSLKVKLYASQAHLALKQNRIFSFKVVNSRVAGHNQVSNQQRAKLSLSRQNVVSIITFIFNLSGILILPCIKS